MFLIYIIFSPHEEDFLKISRGVLVALVVRCRVIPARAKRYSYGRLYCKFNHNDGRLRSYVIRIDTTDLKTYTYTIF